MIFWIDSTSIYDCRTFSLIKPQQYDVARILDYIKQEQQNNKIDIKEKLPKLLRTLALLLIIHNKDDIFRLLKILASKDFYYTKLYNDFMSNPAAQWYIEFMKVEPVQMIMNQYIQGEYKFLESLFENIKNSYQQHQWKLQSGQETLESNELKELQSNQNQISINKKKGKFQKNQKQEKPINKLIVKDIQLERSSNVIKQSFEETKSNQDEMGSQKQNKDVIQQQIINKQKNIIILNELEDKQYEKQKQNEQNKQQQQLVINSGRSYFSEKQKITMEQIFKDDKPYQQKDGMDKLQSEIAQQKSTYTPQSHQFSKIINTEQQIETQSETKKINLDTLNDQEQQEFEFTEDTELIKLYDLLKDKCKQIQWWSKFSERCLKAMSDKELEMIMFEKLPILMKRWAQITRKNVTAMEIDTNKLLPVKETLIKHQNTQGLTTEISNIIQTQEKLYNQKQNEDDRLKIDNKFNLNSIELNNDRIDKQLQQINKQSSNQQQEQIQNQYYKNQINQIYEKQQPQQQESINKEGNNFTSKQDEDKYFKKNQLFNNESQELTPYQIIDVDDEIFKSFQGDSKKSQLSKLIKTASNRLNSEIKKSINKNFDHQFKQQDTSLQNNSAKLPNISYESLNDENISNKKIEQQTIQQQTKDQMTNQHQNTVGQNLQSYVNDDIDNLFEDNNNVSNPHFKVISSSILISDQSSLQLDEIQIHNKQLESKEQQIQQKDKDNLNIQEINMKHNYNREQMLDKEQVSMKNEKNEEQKSRDKKTSKSQYGHINNLKQLQNENSENQKTKSTASNNNNEQKRSKSSLQNRDKEKNKSHKKRRSSEKISCQDVLKQMQAEKDAKEKQKEEQKKKEKEEIRQKNIKIAEYKVQKMRQEEIEYQKQYNYLKQQSELQEKKEREFQQQQQYNQQKIQENQQYNNQSQQFNQGHSKSMMYQKEFKNQSNSYKNQQSFSQNYNQNDRYQKNQINNNCQEQSIVQQNQQQKLNSYVFPLEQYGIQEFLTKKDQTLQKNIQKSVVNPSQYNFEQIQSPNTNQNNYRQKSQYNPQQQLFQQQNPKYQQFQQQNPQQQQLQYQNPQSFQQQKQSQFSEQQQYFHNQKPKNRKFRNNQSHEPDFYHQKHNYQNHQEPQIQKQRKYNPYHQQYDNSNNQSFNQDQSPQLNMNFQTENREINYSNPSFYPNSPINQSDQPSKQQMFEFFCQMFFDKFQQAK